MEILPMMAARSGMGMYDGAIAGNDKVLLWDEATFNKKGGLIPRSLLRCKFDAP